MTNLGNKAKTSYSYHFELKQQNIEQVLDALANKMANSRNFLCRAALGRSTNDIKKAHDRIKVKISCLWKMPL